MAAPSAVSSVQVVDRPGRSLRASGDLGIGGKTRRGSEVVRIDGSCLSKTWIILVKADRSTLAAADLDALDWILIGGSAGGIAGSTPSAGDGPRMLFPSSSFFLSSPAALDDDDDARHLMQLEDVLPHTHRLHSSRIRLSDVPNILLLFHFR